MKRAIIFSLFLAPVFAFAAPLSNAGFLQGGIWYSKDPFFAGETVRVYAAIFNSGNGDISGTVEFLDNQKSLGKSDFFVERGGKFSQVWIDWNVDKGRHSVEAIITKASLVGPGGVLTPVEIAQTKAQEDSRLVEEDTDKDQVGNSADADDDNDGVSDAEEIKKGANPLLADNPALPEEKLAESKETGAEKNFTDELISFLPEEVEGGISQAHEFVREALEPVKETLEVKTGESRNRLQALKGTAGIPQKETLLESVYLASLAAAAFVFRNEIILYLAGLFIGYFILKAAFRRIF